VSGWGQGAAWSAAMATDSSTIGVPAVADHCAAIGAHTDHVMTSQEPWYGEPGGEGELRYYSGRGPRIDGVQKPDIAAPDNPWAAAPHIPGTAQGSVSYAAVWPFGGTSGAGPHVSGVAALLAQAGIKGDAARDAIRSGAIHDDITGTTPNADFGWGRLSAAGALGVEATGSAPSVSLVADPPTTTVGESVTLRPTATDPDGASSDLEQKWDDGYDGTWDTAYGPVGPRTVTKKTAQPEPFKVRVRDKQGRIAEAVVWVAFGEVQQPDAGPPNDASQADAEQGDAGIGPEPAPVAPPQSEEDGCGCRTLGGPAPGRSAWMSALGLVLLALSRRGKPVKRSKT
jgi:MYXO-CTERM domain-containing protein